MLHDAQRQASARGMLRAGPAPDFRRDRVRWLPAVLRMAGGLVSSGLLCRSHHLQLR